ncbi:MAG: hypothetical protein AAF125_24285, partial [Chloroflexota bacterium]
LADAYLSDRRDASGYDNALAALQMTFETYPDHPLAANAEEDYQAVLLEAGLEASEVDTLGLGGNDLGSTLLGGSNDPIAQYERAERLLTTFVDAYPDHPEFDTANTTLADVLHDATVFSWLTAVGEAPGRADNPFAGTALDPNANDPTPLMDFSRAIVLYSRFLERFPDDARAGDARTQLDMLIARQEEISGEIPQPDGIAIPGDETVLVIQNASPNPLRVSLLGAEIRQENIPACETCEVFDEPPIDGCSSEGPTATITLRPGDYQISVFSGDGNVTPFFGNWSLSGGFGYPQCFFVVRSER